MYETHSFMDKICTTLVFVLEDISLILACSPVNLQFDPKQIATHVLLLECFQIYISLITKKVSNPLELFVIFYEYGQFEEI
jgi:hypothetical protein